MASLTFNNICVQGDRGLLVDSVSAEVNPGELVVILGANGAGKTTLLKAILGLVDINLGHACIDTQPIVDLDVTQRALQLPTFLRLGH